MVTSSLINKALINSWKWEAVNTPNSHSMLVYPTDWAKYLAASHIGTPIIPIHWLRTNPAIPDFITLNTDKQYKYRIGLTGWKELYQNSIKGSAAQQNLHINTESMKNQYICHQMGILTVLNGTWSLDQWRPDLGLNKTMYAGCKP